MDDCEIAKILKTKVPEFVISDEDRKKFSTFSGDEKLPPLPVPDLQETLTKYLDCVSAIAPTPEDYRRTEFTVLKFLANEGPQLQKELLKRASTKSNWLEDWWSEFAYLRSREPQFPYGMMSGPSSYHKQRLVAKEGSQIERAALMLYYHGCYWKLLRSGKLVPDRRANGEVVSMNQYRMFYNTTKIPGAEVDHFENYFRTIEEGLCPNHVIVGYKGRHFVIHLTKDEEGEYILTPPEFEQQLRKIEEIFEAAGSGPGIGSFLALDRPTWAAERKRLIELSPLNAETFAIFNTAVMGLVLSDLSPQNDDELTSSTYLPKDSGIMWPEKSSTLMVFKNGLIGSSVDHSPMDAMVMVACSYFIDIKLWQDGGKWNPKMAQPDDCNIAIVEPKEIVLHMDSTAREVLENGKRKWEVNRKSINVTVPRFLGYGRTLMRKHKLHPDTIVQLAIQLAYYRVYGKPVATYETATTRRFYHARTETIRSCTPEAVKWCRQMVDEGCQQSDWVPSDTATKLFAAAHKKHNWLRSECESARGCDRHLMGLDILAAQNKMPRPEIFTDPMWKRAGGDGNFLMSTSFVGYTTLHGLVGPMCDHGYGVFYRIGADLVQFAVTTWSKDKETENSSIISVALRQSLQDIEKIFTGNNKDLLKSRL